MKSASVFKRLGLLAPQDHSSGSWVSVRHVSCAPNSLGLSEKHLRAMWDHYRTIGLRGLRKEVFDHGSYGCLDFEVVSSPKPSEVVFNN